MSLIVCNHWEQVSSSVYASEYLAASVFPGRSESILVQLSVITSVACIGL